MYPNIAQLTVQRMTAASQQMRRILSFLHPIPFVGLAALPCAAVEDSVDGNHLPVIESGYESGNNVYPTDYLDANHLYLGCRAFCGDNIHLATGCAVWNADRDLGICALYGSIGSGKVNDFKLNR
jgi:hypothetical protein